MGYLSGLANQLSSQALAPTTFRLYNRAFREFRSFCWHAALRFTPISEHNLILYTTFLSQRISSKSIRTYLAGIQFMSTFLGHTINISGMRRLHYLVRGIKRSQGSSFTRPLRQPIRISHLEQMLIYLRRSSLCAHDRSLLWSAATLAFFGLLRCSEFCAPTIRSYGQHTLLVSDVNISTDVGGILLNIRASKTDPFRSGCKIHIGPTDDHLCPVNALHVYIRYRNLHVGPLFVFSDGTYLTRSRLCSFLSSCFGHAYPINTHSFRIGGASALAAAGVPDATIQVLGRWASNCFTRYLQLPPTFTRLLSSRMVVSPISPIVWDPHLGRPC